jgi:hypothetical protein
MGIVVMITHVVKRLKWWGIVLGVATLGVSPVLAQTSNLTLSQGFPPQEGTVQGFTRASFSLPTLANRDRNNNACLGFGNNRDVPDHVLVLQNNFSRLNLQVQSRGNSPTLLIQDAKRDTVFCGSSSVTSNFSAGTYRIWVGCDAGSSCNYTLSVRESK